MSSIYKISYTAQDLERLLNSIDGKLNPDDIVKDFTGGLDKVASAELAKILSDRFDTLQNADVFKTLYLNITNAEIYTTEEKEKLQAQDLSAFKGVFSNASLRNAALVTTTYTGKEITFLLDNGLGQQTWDYWDNINHVWKQSKVVAAGTVDSLIVPSIGTVTYTTMDKTKFQSCKMTIQATKTGQYQALEILIGTNGTDTYSVSYAEIGNATLMDIATSITGDFVEVKVTTLASDVTLKARKTAEI